LNLAVIQPLWALSISDVVARSALSTLKKYAE